MAKPLLGGLIALMAMGISPEPSNSVELPPAHFHLKFALILDGNQPIVGDADCALGKECTLLNSSSPSVLITMTTEMQLYNNDNVTIVCTPSCSFPQGLSSERITRRAELAIFSGSDILDQNTLVLRNRDKIGRLFIMY